jgi:anthranilate synthase component I
MIINTFPPKDEYERLARKFNVVPVCTEILADTETPVSLLKKFNDRKQATFLLESVEGGERWGRYSFLGTSAIKHVRIFNDRVAISGQNQTKEIDHKGDPLAVLRTLLDDFKPAQLPGLPRFWGGLVGYFTYEMVGFVEAIKNRMPADKPLAHFIVPDELIIFDNVTHSLFVVAITFPQTDTDNDNAYDRALDTIYDLIETIRAPLAMEAAGMPATVEDPATPISADDFRDKIRKIKDHIMAGDVIQTVFSQPFISDTPPDPWLLYRAQRYINPSPYLFCFNFEETVLVGSSPETMVRLEEGVATLRPIAGTRPRGDSEQEDRALADELLADEKERAEHLMLVDLGRNDLGRVAETGSVQVTDLMIVERYSHVMHLVSNINCDLRDDCDALDLFAASFPAGTLSGAPKVRAMEIIADLEDTPRGVYGGAVGYISFSGNMDLAITIRTASIENGSLTVRAGAGIVADSDPEKERLETVSKASAILKALKMVGSETNLRPPIK